MIVAVITASSAEEAWKQLVRVSGCAGVELRLDYWLTLDFAALKELRKKSPVPIIFTLRDAVYGGQYTGSESERLIALTTIAELCQESRSLAANNESFAQKEMVPGRELISKVISKSNLLPNEVSISQGIASYPDFLDVEHSVSDSFLSQLKEKFPFVNIVRSYHNYQSTPKNLEQLLDTLLHPAVSVYKLATMATSVLDGLSMLNLVQRRHKAIPLVGLCLGEIGQFTRVLAPVVGGAWNYAPIDEQISLMPGQLSLQTLQTIYNVERLNKKTAIYGLIGDPVAHSVGHLFHNNQFKRFNHNAVYVKFRCRHDELDEFFKQIKNLNIKGLSVTMPLKSALPDFVEYADGFTRALHIANTLSFNKGRIEAFNTDAPGALAAIQKHMTVKNKKVLIIGSGGTAKAISLALSLAGSFVTVINRKELQLEWIQAQSQSPDHDFEPVSILAPSPTLLTIKKLKAHHHDFDLVINTIPSYLESQNFISEIANQSLSPETIAMDCTYHPEETLFLAVAKRIGSRLILGKELFQEQAIRQLQVWGMGQ